MQTFLNRLFRNTRLFELKKQLFFFYAFQFFSFFSLAMPIFNIYLKSRGLTYTQISMLVAILFVSQFLFEVPSGMIADRFSRKTCLIMAGLLKSLAVVLFLLATSFWTYIFGQIAFGMGLAFENGIDSAFLYDTLKAHRIHRFYKDVEGRAFSYKLMGSALACFLGGFVAQYSLSATYKITMVTLLLAPLFASCLTEPKQATTTRAQGLLTSAVLNIVRTPELLSLILIYSLSITSLIMGFVFLQPYLKMVNVELRYFGIIYTFFLFISSLSSRHMRRLSGRLGEFNSVVFLYLIQLFALATLFLPVGAGCLILFTAVECVYGAIRPTLFSQINRLVASHNRATVTSVTGFINGTAFFILSPFIGWLADNVSIKHAFLANAVFLFLALTPVLLWWYRLRHRDALRPAQP